MQFRETFRSWPRGVVSSGRPDRIHAESATDATNAALVHITGSPVTAVPQKRLGCSIQTAAGVTGNAAILGLDWFRRRSGATYTDYSLAASSGGRLDKLAGGAWTQADSGTATWATSDADGIPSMETMNNLWFIVNGADQKKFDGTNITKFGIAAPAAPTEAVLGDSGNPNGTYQFKITYYNSNTGHESSASPVSDDCVASSKKITVSWVAPAGVDEQITHVRVFVRETSTQSTWFRLNAEADSVLDGGAYASAHGGWAVDAGAGSIRLDITTASINDLIIKVPGESENNPPSSSASSITKYASRMFYTDGVDLFYSKIGFPEAFDSSDYERVNPDDGQRIIGLLAVTEGMLFIFKEHSLYALRGVDPNSWEIRLVSESIGLSGVRSFTTLDGIAYWWSQFGPYQWSSSKGVQPIGFPDVSDKFDESAVNASILHLTIVNKDVERQRIFFAYPDNASTTRNTKLLVYNHRLQVWEGVWDPMDISALGNLPGTNNAPFLHIGNYSGRLFRMWDGAVDGVRLSSGGTFYTLSGSVTGSTNNTLTDSTATFDTANDGLDQLVVIAIAPDGSTQRRIILSNTGTALTVTANWSINPTTDYTYVIAAPDFAWSTIHSDRVQGRDGVMFPAPFRRKRYKQLLVSALSSTGNANVDVDVHLDTSDTRALSVTASASEVSGAVFGTAIFDTSVFGEAGVATIKKRIGRSGRTVGFVVRNREPNTHILLLALSYMGTLVSEKS